MHAKLEEVKELFEMEYDLEEGDFQILEGDNGWTTLEYFGQISFGIDKDGGLAVSFFSGTHPIAAASHIKFLYDNGVTEFEIYENMHPIWVDGECTRVLFGKEADERYELDHYGYTKPTYEEVKAKVESVEGYKLLTTKEEFEKGNYV
jgi:hypothetical protein